MYVIKKGEEFFTALHGYLGGFTRDRFKATLFTFQDATERSYNMPGTHVDVQRDVFGRAGVVVADHWSEGGGWEVFEDRGKFYLYENPMYGCGEPREYDHPFDTIEAAIAVAKTWT